MLGCHLGIDSVQALSLSVVIPILSSWCVPLRQNSFTFILEVGRPVIYCCTAPALWCRSCSAGLSNFCC
jgi:hypothetical protein